MTAPATLLRLLDACEDDGVQAPKGTRDIRVDGRCAVLLSRRLDIAPDFAYEVFGGFSVKEARAVCSWTARLEQEERVRALRNWRRNRDGRGAA